MFPLQVLYDVTFIYILMTYSIKENPFGMVKFQIGIIFSNGLSKENNASL